VWWSKFPPGFTADEAVFGYNAYSLLKTGKDEFGASWPIALRAFGDWRPALYSYLAVPFVYIFGLTEMAVRMPSILLGSATIPVVMGIAWILTGNKLVTVLAGLILALSPTHILISRFADMSPLSTFFLGMGVMCFLWWKKKARSAFLLASAVSFSLSALSYHNARLTGPLLLTVLAISNFSLIKRSLKEVAIALVCGIVVLSPLLIFIFKSPEMTLRRGKYESFLSQKGYEIRLWNLVSSNPSQQNPLITRFFHNKPKIILQELGERYLSHFSPWYLFWSGDPHERFQTPNSGVYNFVLFLLFPVGFIVSLRRKNLAILPIWWLVSPLISSIGIFTPNSLHTLDASIPAAVMAGIGAKKLSGKFPGATKVLLLTVGVVIFSVSLSSFLKGYFYTIPRSNKLRWNWYPQTKELIGWINNLTGNDKVIVIGNRSMHEFILFNNSVDPAYYQKFVVVSNIPDENGFERVEGFGRYRFDGKLDSASVSGVDWIIFDKDSLPESLIWQVTDCAFTQDKTFFELKTQIMDLGQPVYSIYYFPNDQLGAKSKFCALNN